MQVRGQCASQICQSPMSARWLRWARALRAWRRRLILHFSRALMTLVRPQKHAPQVPRCPTVRITQPRLFLSLVFRNYMSPSSKNESGHGTAPPRMPWPPPMATLAREHILPAPVWQEAFRRIHLQPMLFPRHETRLQAVDQTYRQFVAQVQPIFLSSELHLVIHGPVSAEPMELELPAQRLRRQTKRHEWTREGRPALIVRQPERRVAPPERSSASGSPTAMTRFDERRVDAGWAAAPPLSALNMDSLTNEVIRQIDRRIVAQRERVGRV